MSKHINYDEMLKSVASCISRAGDGFTSYAYAKQNKCTPKTALKHLRKLASQGYLIESKNNHRPNVHKYVFFWSKSGVNLARFNVGYASRHEALENAQNR